MKKAIIIHGKPQKEGYYNPKYGSQSNKHWIPWIQKELIIRDILAQTPEMPKPYEPIYRDWKIVFEQFIIDEDTILIGHSCGGGFLVRWLSENSRKVGKVVLVAPWIDPGKSMKTKFFDFEMDQNLISRTDGISIFVPVEDDKTIQISVEMLESQIKDLKVIKLKGMGHFTYRDMNKREFPELLKEIVDA